MSHTLEEYDAQVAREMVARHELTPAAGRIILELATFGHDVRAYYSASGKPFVWAFDTRYTATEWNAHVEQGSRKLLAWLALPYGTMPADVNRMPARRHDDDDDNDDDNGPRFPTDGLWGV